MEKLPAYFKALSDETRLRIIKLLEHGELCVCDITAALDTTQPNISFHLSILKEAGLIKDRKQGRWNHYELAFGDIMNRVLLPTVLPRIESAKVVEDRERLARFLNDKTAAKCCPVKAAG